MEFKEGDVVYFNPTLGINTREIPQYLGETATIIKGLYKSRAFNDVYYVDVLIHKDKREMTTLCPIRFLLLEGREPDWEV